MRFRHLIIFLIISMGAACGGDGSTVVGNPSVLTGVLSWSDGKQVSGGTIYVTDANQTISQFGLSNTCEPHGGKVTCDQPPPEGACAVSCSCADGTYELNLENCKNSPTSLNYCANGICNSVALPDCEGSHCTPHIIVAKTPLVGWTAALCDKFDECNLSPNKNTCAFEMKNLDIGEDTTLGEAQTMLQNNQLFLDTNAFGTCLNRVQSLACDDFKGKVNSLQDLPTVANLLTSWCSENYPFFSLIQ